MLRLKILLIIFGPAIAFSQLILTDGIGRCDVNEGNSSEARCCPGYIGENRILPMPMHRMFNLQMNYPFYFQKIYDLKCERLCDKQCYEFGKCIALNRCDCSLNVGGANCEKECPPLTFGPNCEHNCSCLTNSTCNPNYTICSCKEKKLTEECEKICKCQRFPCHHGWFGKNCDLRCKPGTCGLYCSKNCTCVHKNMAGCSSENCDCICKEGFHGSRCERRCDGVLNCPNNSTIHCTCELTPEQKAEELRKEKAEELRKQKEKMEQWCTCLLFVLACLLMLKFALCYNLYRVRRANKRIQMDLDFVVSYANHRTNPIYQSDSRPDEESGGSTISKSFKKTAPRIGSVNELRVADENCYATIKI